MQGLAMSVALLGCLIGAMVAGMMADRYGRKPLLIISAFIFLSSAYATGAFSVFSWFLAARFLGGIGIGIASGLSPMYIAEVAPASIRGKLVSLNQLTIVLGILGAQITNWLIAEPIPADFSLADICASWNGQMGWRWMFWAAAFPAAIFLLLACFIPESPRWLAMKGKEGKAWNVLSKIGGDDYAGQELRLVEETGSSKSEGGLRLLFSRPFRKVLVLGIIVAVFQQWCGTNVIFNYAQEIFQSAGYSLGDVLFNIVVTGVANVIFTFVAIYTVFLCCWEPGDWQAFILFWVLVISSKSVDSLWWCWSFWLLLATRCRWGQSPGYCSPRSSRTEYVPLRWLPVHLLYGSVVSH
jgi:sugar porter (SP) family MFS transporter